VRLNWGHPRKTETVVNRNNDINNKEQRIMENNKMTELELKIDKWLENEQFVAFANEQMNNVLLNKRHPIDPIFEEMDEGFDEEDEYVVPMVEYLSSRLHKAKLCKNRRKREKELWWVWYEIAMQGIYIKVFNCYYENLVEELRLEIMPMLHREYMQLQKKSKK